MREIRQSGSEGGETGLTGLPYPYHKKLGHGPGERPWPSDGWEFGRRFAHFLCAAGLWRREDANERNLWTERLAF